MPYSAHHPCNHPNCGALTHNRYCDKHKKQKQQAQDRQRGTAHQRGYDSRWRKASKAYLADNPICVRCLKQGIVKPSKVTDHIIPHEGDKKLFWDRTNWQALCKPCHDHKTATEDGGFGR